MGDSGVHTFIGVTFVTAGNQTITATDTTTSSITGTSGAIAVSAAAATHFTVSAPSTGTAGSSFSFIVTAADQFNNTVTGYGGTVHFTTTDGVHSLPVDSTLSSGSSTFNATLDTAGNQTITATDITTSSLTGTSNIITIGAAGVDHLRVSAPSTGTAGSAFSVTVTALDAFNNTATTYLGTVHFTKSDSGTGSAVPANYTFVAGDNGVHTFTGGVTFVTAGSQTVTATDTTTSSITGSATVRVSPAAATHFTLAASPTSTTAGGSVNVTVTAQDAFNNTATGYTGTVHFTSTDGQAGLPANSTLTSGTRIFSVPLRTAGPQTVTATDTVTSSITGTSNVVNVNATGLSRFLVSVPATATTGSAFSFTVTAVDPFFNLVNSYNGTVHFTSSDGAANLPVNTTLTNGTASPSITLNTSGSQTITATDVSNGSLNGTSSSIAVRGLTVSSFTATPTGFTVAFSKPFVNSSSNPINIYDAASASYGAADVTLVGSGSIGTIKGTLIINATNTGFTFVKTNVVPGGTTAGLLAAGTYTATLVSSSTAFKDTTGALLDGNNSGVNGTSFTTTFTVGALAGVAVTVPDFARGPDSTDVINVPNNSTNGIPIALSSGSGVTDATFVLNYNANLLSITGGTVNPALTGATFTVTTSGSGTSAQATIVFHSPTALAAAAVRLGGLTATVPANAAYKSKALLHFASLSVNNGAIAAVGDDGLEVVAFLGDASGDGTYTSADSGLISRVSSAADSGFAAFPVLDPVILGDLSGDGKITAVDASLANNYLSGTTVTQVPNYPGAPSNNPAGPDPALSIPTALLVGTDGTVVVPVEIDDPKPDGSTGVTQALLALTYDPSVFSVSAADIHLGSVPTGGTGWTLQSTINSTTGEIGIILFSATPISTSTGGSLVNITFHVQPGATPQATSVNLATAVNPTGHRVITTALDDNQGPLTLHPAPTALAAPVAGSVSATPDVGSLANDAQLPAEAAESRSPGYETVSVGAAGISEWSPSLLTDEAGAGTVPTTTFTISSSATPLVPRSSGIGELVDQVFRELARSLRDSAGRPLTGDELNASAKPLSAGLPGTMGEQPRGMEALLVDGALAEARELTDLDAALLEEMALDGRDLSADWLGQQTGDDLASRDHYFAGDVDDGDPSPATYRMSYPCLAGVFAKMEGLFWQTVWRDCRPASTYARKGGVRQNAAFWHTPPDTVSSHRTNGLVPKLIIRRTNRTCSLRPSRLFLPNALIDRSGKKGELRKQKRV